MEKDDILRKMTDAAERLRSLDDTEEIPILDQDFKPRRTKRRKKKRKLRMPVAAIFGILLSLLAAGGIAGLYFYENILGEQISLLDASMLSFDGYNGKGSVTAGFAPEKTAIKALEKKAQKLQEQGKDASNIYAFADSIVCGFNQSEALSNGDAITYACTYNADFAKAAHIRVVNDQKSYKVSGLADLRVLDPFEGVSADWVINGSGTDVSFSVPQLMKDLGISYRWSFGTESNTYNGEYIYAEADYNSNTLADYGYVIENDTRELRMGAFPSVVTSITELSYEEQTALVAQVEEILKTELAACGQTYTLNGEPLTVKGYGSGYLSQNSVTVWYEPETAFTVTFDLKMDNPRNGGFFSNFYTYTTSYSGTIYRYSDGTVQFKNRSNHGCYFGGYIGIYHVAHENESSEIFGGMNMQDIRDMQNQVGEITEEIFEEVYGEHH